MESYYRHKQDHLSFNVEVTVFFEERPYTDTPLRCLSSVLIFKVFDWRFFSVV